MSDDDFINIDMKDAPGMYTLAMNVEPKHTDIGFDSKFYSTQCCVTIKACDIDDDNFNRAPVDIVIALDVSGSMHGNKLTLCKKTLELLLRCLCNKDRFGLITYATNACVAVPSKFMTKENKENALEIIRNLRTKDCTNISDAIGLACQEFRNIEKPNEVQTLFLLTDGLTNRGICDPEGLCKLTENYLMNNSIANTDLKAPITLHTFGYGTDHNSALLGDLAAVTQGGSYYFVEDDSSVSAAFGDALGGVLSVVAQSVVVTIKPSSANRITKVYHDQAVKRENGVFTVAIGDFYAEEIRDIIFEVDLIKPEVPSLQKIPHASVSLMYTDTIKKIPVSTMPTECSISRSHGLGISAVSQYVTKQWLRVITVEELKAAETMGRSNQLFQARDRLQNLHLRITNECKSGNVKKNDDMVACMMNDVEECIKQAQTERQFNDYGMKRIRASHMSHKTQRCADSREDDDRAFGSRSNPYVTKRKAKTKAMFSER